MDILQYNGGAVIAMKGKNCVAIGTDVRYGNSNQLISTKMNKIYKCNDHLFIGLPGLVSDAQTVYEKLTFRKNLFELRENRTITPTILTRMLANIMYEKRFTPFYIEPVVAGIDIATKTPYIAGMDILGCVKEASNEDTNYSVGGTCVKQLYGMCETMWSPDLLPDDLFEMISQSLLSGLDRDALSGSGAIVYVIESDKITMRNLKARTD